MKYRTDLVAYSTDLLDFAEERLNEAQEDPSWREAALDEAAFALRLMEDRLRRENKDDVIGPLAVSGFFEQDLKKLSGLTEGEFTEKAADLRRRFELARSLLENSAHRLVDPSNACQSTPAP